VSDHPAAAKFFGERLRELRQRHALTQEHAAALCGMEYKYYQMVEWGRKNLRLDTMARIASAYHLEIWDLVQRDGLPPSQIDRIPEVGSAPHRLARLRGRPRKTKP
jgi:transcriptional regulator with XRE-family HTH domain